MSPSVVVFVLQLAEVKDDVFNQILFDTLVADGCEDLDVLQGVVGELGAVVLEEFDVSSQAFAIFWGTSGHDFFFGEVEDFLDQIELLVEVGTGVQFSLEFLFGFQSVLLVVSVHQIVELDVTGVNATAAIDDWECEFHILATELEVEVLHGLHTVVGSETTVLCAVGSRLEVANW